MSMNLRESITAQKMIPPIVSFARADEMADEAALRQELIAPQIRIT